MKLLFYVCACLHSLACNQCQDCGGLSGNCKNQAGKYVCTIARFICSAAEQLHPPIFFFFLLLLCPFGFRLGQLKEMSLKETCWILAAALVPSPRPILPCQDVQHRALKSAVCIWTGNEACDAQLDSRVHLLRNAIYKLLEPLPFFVSLCMRWLGVGDVASAHRFLGQRCSKFICNGGFLWCGLFFFLSLPLVSESEVVGGGSIVFSTLVCIAYVLKGCAGRVWHFQVTSFIHFARLSTSPVFGRTVSVGVDEMLVRSSS